MAYSAGVISIPNVNGNIVITVQTSQKGFSFDMNRTIVRRGSDSRNIYTTPSLWDETKVYDDINWSNGVSNNTTYANLSDKTSNSITATATGSSVGAFYPIKVTGGKTYTLSYDFSGAGSVRTYYKTNIDGNLSNLITLYNGSNGEISDPSNPKSHDITIDPGTECWLFLTLGVNTNNTKSYTNVSLVEKPD